MPPAHLCGKPSTNRGGLLVSLSSIYLANNTSGRNHVPWEIIGVSYVVGPFTLLLIRALLAAENKRRDAEPPDLTYDDVYIEVITSDGKRVEKKVDKVRFTPISVVVADIDPWFTGISGSDRHSES